LAFGFRVKELVNGLIIAPIGGGLVGLIVYILTSDISVVPGSPIPKVDVLLYATVSGAITFAGLLWLSLKDAIMTSKEVKFEDAKEKIDELLLNKMLEDIYEMEKAKMKKEIEDLKNQSQNKS